MTTFSASDSRKAIVQDAAVKEAVDHLSHIGPEKAVLGCEPIIINLLQRLKVVFNALIIL